MKTDERAMLYHAETDIFFRLIQKPVMLIAGVFGILTAFTSSFELHFNNAVIILSMMVLIILSVLIFSLKKHKIIIILITSAAYILAAIILRESIISGLILIADQVNSDLNLISDITVVSQAEYCITAAIIAVGYPIIMLLCYAVYFKPNFAIILLVTIPILEVCFYYSYGKAPAISYILIFACIFSTIVIDISVNNTGKLLMIQSKSEVLKYAASVGNGIIIIVTVIIIIVTILIPENIYNSKIAALINKNKVITAFSMIDLGEKKFDFSMNNPSSAGISNGDLSRADKFEFNGNTALKITIDKKESELYLKGFVGAYYEDSQWKSLPDKYTNEFSDIEKKSDNNVNSYNTKILSYDEAVNSPVFNCDKNKIVVENVSANPDYVYMPYNMITDNLQGIKFNSDTLAYTSSDFKLYQSEFYDIANYDNNIFMNSRDTIKNVLLNNASNSNGKYNMSDINKLFENEKEYSSFVHEAYTSLPDEGLSRIKKEFTGMAQKYETVSELIKVVYGRISSAAAYSLTPGNYPSGEDFAEYFLYENRQGYSTHFATAAALIFRAAGVPARYVEGYIITPKNFSGIQPDSDGKYTLEVKDENAHAWVEIYLDGFGWVPVEMTPQYSNFGIDKDKYGNMLEVEFEATMAGNQTMPEVTKDTEISADSETIVSSDETSLQNKEADSSKNESSNRNDHIKNRYIILLISVFFLMLIISVILLRRRHLLYERKKVFSTDNNVMNIKNCFNYIIHICKNAGYETNSFISYIEFAKIVDNKNFEGIIKKIMTSIYANNDISDETTDEIICFANQLAKDEYHKLKFISKISYKFIQCMI